MKKTYVIIGASAAGIGALNRLARLAPTDQIICIAAQQVNPYNTCLLADYCAGKKTHAELSIFNLQKAPENVIMKLGVRVETIDPRVKQVLLSDGKMISYDALFIGTGTTATIPPIDGIRDGRGVFTFQTMADCQQIMDYRVQHGVTKAVVIGAGLTGLECADALAQHGVSVTVVEKQDRVLSHLVSPEGSTFIQKAMNAMDVEFYPGQTVTRVCVRDGCVSGIELGSGIVIQVQMVIVAVGARQNSELVQRAGIAVSENGIVTDEYLRTSIEGVWAGGDGAQVACAYTNALIASCTWPDAMLQGLTAAHGMTGDLKRYQGATRITDSAFFGLQFQAGGVPFSDAVNYVMDAQNREELVAMLFIVDKKVVGYFCCSTGDIPLTFKKLLLGVIPYAAHLE